MRRTGQYRLVYYSYGDIYRASLDRHNMVTVDRQLKDLSSIVGDGVLEGWTLSSSGSNPARLLVAPGRGFIDGIFVETFGFQSVDLSDDATSLVYMISSAAEGDVVNGLNLAVESPLEPLPSDSSLRPQGVVYANGRAPDAPTGFRGQAVHYSTIQLFWDDNTEVDFDHYEIQRSTDDFVSDVTVVASPNETAEYPGAPFQDAGLIAETQYWYRIRAVDTAGNASAWVEATLIDGTTPQPILTPEDTTQPGPPRELHLFAGDGRISLSFSPSLSLGVASYVVKVQKVDLIGIPYGNVVELAEDPSTTATISSLENHKRYRVSVYAKAASGNLSNPTEEDVTLRPLGAPADVSSLVATPQPGGVLLAWDPSVSGSVVRYLVTVYDSAMASEYVPVDVGLNESRLLTGYSVANDFGVGEFESFKVDTNYVFRVQAVDSAGRKSVGLFAKSGIVDSVPPKAPSSMTATPHDGSVACSWRRSQSEDVVGYFLSYRIGSGAWSADIALGDVDNHVLTGLANGTSISVRVRAADDASNLSIYSSAASATPVADTTPPSAPTGINVSSDDAQVRLAWSSVPESDVAEYEVMRRRLISIYGLGGEGDLPLDMSDDPNHPLPIQVMSVGKATEFVDLQLTNGKQYAYNVRAIDNDGNIGPWSVTNVVSPSSGANEETDTTRRLIAPTKVSASYDDAEEAISVNWEYWYPTGDQLFGNETFFDGTATYPDDGPTSFNIYRSSAGPNSGYVHVATVDSSAWSYMDATGLIDGKTYWYAVSAVRENVSLHVEMTSAAPASSVLIGVAKTSSGVCTELRSERRIVDNLESSIADEVSKRLLLHRHNATILNEATVVAPSSLGMIDVYDLIEQCFSTGASGSDSFSCSQSLSPDASQSYFKAVSNGFVVESSAGEYVEKIDYRNLPYLPRQAYVIDPRMLTWNAPEVGNFQVLLDGSPASYKFRIDQTNNIVIFDQSIPQGSVVQLSGMGFSYYAPVRIDGRAAKVLVDGQESPQAQVDSHAQTIHFQSPNALSSECTLVLEPLVPEYGDTVKSKPINLSSDAILDDFVNLDGRIFQSKSGDFSATDTVYPIDEDGDPIDGYLIDFDKKRIVLDQPVGLDANLSLVIRNRPEVDGVLPADRIRGIDGSRFSSGRFVEGQIPSLSHEGRMNETAEPLFTNLTTANGYVYPMGDVAGNAVTPYSILYDENALLIGTSAGVRKAVFGTLYANASDQLHVDNAQLSLVDMQGEVYQALLQANKRSGMLQARLSFNLEEGQTVSIDYPSMISVSSSLVLICGGIVGGQVSSASYVYDLTTSEARRVGDMASPRVYHPIISSAGGHVLVIGGRSTSGSCLSVAVGESFVPNSGGISARGNLTSVEVFSVSSETWTTRASIPEARAGSAAIECSNGDILVAGGFIKSNPDATGSNNDAYTWEEIKSSPTGGTQFVKWCDKKVETIQGVSSWRYSFNSDTWSADADTPLGGEISKAGSYDSTPYFEVEGKRLVYDGSTWNETQALPQELGAASSVADFGPIKKMIKTGASGAIVSITRAKILISYDNGANWTETRGLEPVGVVHDVSEVQGVLHAATDLGVYTMSDSDGWTQGGLIGAGTTETFALLPWGGGVLAATEIGVFFSDDGASTWSDRTASIGLQNITNIVEFSGKLIATSESSLWQSEDGNSWTLSGRHSFLDANAKLIVRDSDLFAATGQGLYRSTDAQYFSLVDFDENRNSALNSVQSVAIAGNDLAVCYERSVYLVGYDLSAIKIASFDGIMPTVKVNNVVEKNGYRIDVVSKELIFERKRLSSDQVSATSDYSTYAPINGPWYAQNPDSPVQVFVNGKETECSVDAWRGMIVFSSPLTKKDAVSISIPGTYITETGSYFHRELEDKLEREKGLPLSMNRDLVGNVLQMGLSLEHNFSERAIERSQYGYGSEYVYRSFAHFMSNSSFYIMGRKEFDRINSTVDYRLESEQKDPGYSAKVCLSAQVIDNMVFMGTDTGLFYLSSLPGATEVPALKKADFAGMLPPIRFIGQAFGETYVVAANGIFVLSITSGNVELTEMTGAGLPDVAHAVAPVGEVLVAATSDGLYFADTNSNGSYSEWTKARLLPLSGSTDLPVLGPATAISVDDGFAIAAVGNEIYRSDNGRTWRRATQLGREMLASDMGDVSSATRALASATVIKKIEFLGDQVYLATSSGLLKDNGTMRSSTPVFQSETLPGGTFGLNDITAHDPGDGTVRLVAVGETPYVYHYQEPSQDGGPLTATNFSTQQSEWQQELAGAYPAFDRVVVLPDGRAMLFYGNSVLIG